MSRKILIVEDNDLNMKLFHDLLEVHGYETVQTRDGREVIHLAKEHRPDLILMDIWLSDISAGGLEVIRWIKEDEELSGIPVICVSAYATDMEKLMKYGFDALITKPIKIAN